MDKVYYAPKGTIDWHELGEPISGVNVISEEPTTDWSPNASLSFTLPADAAILRSPKKMGKHLGKMFTKLPRKTKKRVKQFMNENVGYVLAVFRRHKPISQRELIYDTFLELTRAYGKNWYAKWREYKGGR